MAREHYTPAQQRAFFRKDLLSDAAQAEEQAAHGAFFPEKDITRESLLRYARECRKQAQNAGPVLKRILAKFFGPARA